MPPRIVKITPPMIPMVVPTDPVGGTVGAGVVGAAVGAVVGVTVPEPLAVIILEHDWLMPPLLSVKVTVALKEPPLTYMWFICTATDWEFIPSVTSCT